MNLEVLVVGGIRTLERIADASIEMAELELSGDSPLIGQTVRGAKSAADSERS